MPSSAHDSFGGGATQDATRAAKSVAPGIGRWASSLLGWAWPAGSGVVSPMGRPTPVLGIESLESRCVPATITPLFIENTQAFDRQGEPVTSGVPLPQSLALTSPSQLRILDATGREVPAQFRVLGRWGGGVTDAARPIRWLEVHFAADVPARATATYTLDDAGTGSAAGRLATTETADRITVGTGPARFEIDRVRFDLLRSVWLDTNADGVFAEDERIVAPTPTAGPFVRQDGIEYRGNGQPPRAVVLEEAGPLRAVVRAEGFHAADGRPLLRYVTRMTFHAGHGHVEVDHTIIEGRQAGSGNESIEGQVATPIERAGLRLNLQVGGQVTAHLRGDERTVHIAPLSDGQTAVIAQERLTDWSWPMAYRGTINDATVETGQRATRAWAGIGDGRWGVTVGTRDFYRKNPQRLAVQADGTVVVEFPSEPYVIRQAMGLGESVVIRFHAGAVDTAGTERIMEGFGKDRLLATTPGDWARATGALGEVPGRLPQRWAKVDDYLRESAAASLDHAASGAAFGLMHYLDLPIDRFGRASNPDDTAWSNSYWDPAASLAAQFARTDDTRLLEQLLFPMARHFYTTDMYDPDDAGSYTSGIGGARGVSHRGAWTGEYHYLESLWEYFYLTGDPRARERGLAAARTYAFHPQWAVTADQGGFETTTRSLSQKFNTMMEAWLATGDAALKTALDAQVAAYLARRFTPEGFATAGPATGTSYRGEQAFMILLGMHDTMYRYFQLTGDPVARNFVITIPERIAQHHRASPESGSGDFMRFHTNVLVNRIAGGGFSITRITPNGNSDDFFYPEAFVGLATALARAWQVGGDSANRARAEELFDFVIPQLRGAIWDKPNAMASRRLLPGLALLTKAAPPVVPPPIGGPPNVAPTLVGTAGPRIFRPARGPILLAPSATVVDPDTVRFGGSVLIIRVASGGAQRDRLYLAGGGAAPRLSIRGSIVRLDGVAIGTSVGGTANRPLVVTFNRQADRRAVQAVLRSVAFQTTERPFASPWRSIQVTLSEASGAVSRPLLVSLGLRP